MSICIFRSRYNRFDHPSCKVWADLMRFFKVLASVLRDRNALDQLQAAWTERMELRFSILLVWRATAPLVCQPTNLYSAGHSVVLTAIPPPYFNYIYTPLGNSQWYNGLAYNITYSATSSITKVQIYLFKATSVSGSITHVMTINSTALNTGYYLWTIPPVCLAHSFGNHHLTEFNSDSAILQLVFDCDCV